MVTQEMVNEARDVILERSGGRTAQTGLILGSGLGELADQVVDPVAIPYRDIPHFSATSVDLHAGQLLIGELDGRQVAVMQGRLHYYEGRSPAEITFPVYALAGIGVTELVVTNACGAINEGFGPGQVMLIADHLNTTGQNPLRGPNDDRLGPRFPDMAAAYDADLRTLAHTVATEAGVSLHEGVYAWWTGPSLETPAEIRMLRSMGADVVGMSTVPEVLAARHAGLDVLGLACIGNLASGMNPVPITAEDVAAEVANAGHDVLTVVRGILRRLPA